MGCIPYKTLCFNKNIFLIVVGRHGLASLWQGPVFGWGVVFGKVKVSSLSLFTFFFIFFVGFLSVLDKALRAKALLQILNRHLAFSCSLRYLHQHHDKIIKTSRFQMLALTSLIEDTDSKTSGQEGASTGQDGTPTAQGGAPSAQDVAPSAQDVAPSTQDVAPSAQGVASSAQDMAPSAQGAEGALTAKEGAPTAQEKVPTAKEVAQPGPEGDKHIHLKVIIQIFCFPYP